VETVKLSIGVDVEVVDLRNFWQVKGGMALHTLTAFQRRNAPSFAMNEYVFALSSFRANRFGSRKTGGTARTCNTRVMHVRNDYKYMFVGLTGNLRSPSPISLTDYRASHKRGSAEAGTRTNGIETFKTRVSRLV
jgi:hypothetical protein